MNRLTFKDNKGEVWIKDAAHVDEQGQICMLADRLAAYEDAEQEGRLVVLPCKVGDTVYKHWKVGGKTKIGSALVTGFEITKDGINYCYRVKRFDRKETIKKFGKTAFLTRKTAEAEAALKGAEHERDTSNRMV